MSENSGAQTGHHVAKKAIKTGDSTHSIKEKFPLPLIIGNSNNGAGSPGIGP